MSGKAKLALAVCIGCGCDDDHACVDGFDGACSWLRVDRKGGTGVCSTCPEHAARWDAGDRMPSRRAVARP